MCAILIYFQSNKLKNNPTPVLFLLLLPRQTRAALLAPLPLQLRHHALGEEALRDQLIGEPRPALLHGLRGSVRHRLRIRRRVVRGLNSALAGFRLVHPTLVLCRCSTYVLIDFSLSQIHAFLCRWAPLGTLLQFIVVASGFSRNIKLTILYQIIILLQSFKGGGASGDGV